VAKPLESTRRFDLGRLWAYTRREAMELIRDHIRLFFATLVAPIVMIVIAYDVSLDVENVRFAAFDQDWTKESRDVVDAFSSNPGSRLGFEDLRLNLAVLAAFFLAYLVAALLILKKQER